MPYSFYLAILTLVLYVLTFAVMAWKREIRDPYGSPISFPLLVVGIMSIPIIPAMAISYYLTASYQ